MAVALTDRWLAASRSIPSMRRIAPAPARNQRADEGTAASKGDCRPAGVLLGREQDWSAGSVVPVLVAWLIFYSIAIVGALTGLGRSL